MTTTTAATMNVWIADGTPIRDQWTWIGQADTEEQALDAIRNAAISTLTDELTRTNAEMAADTEGRTADEIVSDMSTDLLAEMIYDASECSAALVADMRPSQAPGWAAVMIGRIMPDRLDAEMVAEDDDTTVGTVSLSNNWAGIVERAAS